MATTKKTAKTKTTSNTKPQAAKTEAKPKKAKTAAPPKKVSALDAAAKVLAEKGVAMTCQELIGTMAAAGYWSSPNGKTPAATLYAALTREITTKGSASRFAKSAPGRFAATNATDTNADVPAPTVETPTEPTKPKATKSKGKKSPAKKRTEPADATEAPTIPDGSDGPESMKKLFRF